MSDFFRTHNDSWIALQDHGLIPCNDTPVADIGLMMVHGGRVVMVGGVGRIGTSHHHGLRFASRKETIQSRLLLLI